MPLFILKHTMLVFNYSAYYDKGKHNLQCIHRYMLRSKDISTKICYFKSLVAELAPPHVQSAWGSKGEMVRVVRLAVCCNYFSKKKKKINK